MNHKKRRGRQSNLPRPRVHHRHKTQPDYINFCGFGYVTRAQALKYVISGIIAAPLIWAATAMLVVGWAE